MAVTAANIAAESTRPPLAPCCAILPLHSMSHSFLLDNPLLSGRLKHLRIFMSLGRLKGALSPDDIHRLIADIANQLRLTQAFLLFLLIEDRAQSVIGVFDIAT